ncbi:MAG: histidine kinase N-terminal domain-containing protein [Microthrixaceae bacterium]|nr:histidine kinase N-terminal domain-containing protein [Microthrixaceae bacterium]
MNESPGTGGDPTRFLPPLRGDLAAAKEVELDEEEDFTAEHVALVVPPVDHDASRHLKRLVISWAMLADLSFSDLLLYVPLPVQPGSRPRYLVVNQIRPNTGQTLFTEDVVGRTVDDLQRPLVAQAASERRITEDVVESEWLGQPVKVTAVPVTHNGVVVAVMARSHRLHSPDRQGIWRAPIWRSSTAWPRWLPPATSPSTTRRSSRRVVPGSVTVCCWWTPPVASRSHHPTRSPPCGASACRVRSWGSWRPTWVLRVTACSARSCRVALRSTTSSTVRPQWSPCSIPLLAAGEVDGAVVLMRDVSELRSRDRLLISKDATIREIHHRVKNNLQTISSLLRLQGRRLSEPSAKAAIDESVRRIGSIALVHETLSRGSAADEVDLDEIVRPLVRMVEDGLTSPEKPVSFEILGSGGNVGSPEATSLAVVLTELLQNVMDHAYPRRCWAGIDGEGVDLAVPR